MQISFWNEPEQGTHDSPTLESMRTRYIEAGRLVAERLSKDDNVLGVWLSGPLDASRVQHSSDLHMSVLVARADHTTYQHLLPNFSPVNRRLEIAFLPLTYLNDIAEHGFASWGDVFTAHKLYEPEILYDRNGLLGTLQESLKEAKPKQIFIGYELRRLRLQYRQLEGLLQSKQYAEAVFRSRALLLACMKIHLVTDRQKTFAKTSHLYQFISDTPATATLPFSKDIHHMGNVDSQQAKEVLLKTSSLIKTLFRRKIECDEDSD